MTNYPVYEEDGNTVQKELETNDDIVVGDTISYNTNNQMGYKKYEVILDENGQKNIKLIDSYDSIGGRKRKTKKKKRRKSRKSKRR